MDLQQPANNVSPQENSTEAVVLPDIEVAPTIQPFVQENSLSEILRDAAELKQLVRAIHRNLFLARYSAEELTIINRELLAPYLLFNGLANETGLSEIIRP